MFRDPLEATLAERRRTPISVSRCSASTWERPYFLLSCVVYRQIVWCTGMESLTKQFEQRIAEFLRRTKLTPSEFGERVIGDRKFCGDVRRGRSPRLTTVDRVLAFMEAYEGAAHGARGSTGSESFGDSSSTAEETER